MYPAESSITINGNRRKAMGDQIMTASKRRLLRQTGWLTPTDMGEVERVVRQTLGL